MGNPEVNNVEEVSGCNNTDCGYCGCAEPDYVDVDECVQEFHDTFHCHKDMSKEQIINLRIKLIKEEAREVIEALKWYGVGYGEPEAHLNEADKLNDKANLIKELCDLEYVVSGTILALELEEYMCEAFKEVHRSNMSKVSENGEPIFDKKGKVLKGPNYSPADMVSVIKKVDEFYAEVK